MKTCARLGIVFIALALLVICFEFCGRVTTKCFATETCPVSVPMLTSYWYDPDGPIPGGMGDAYYETSEPCHYYIYCLDGILPPDAEWPAEYNVYGVSLSNWNLWDWDCGAKMDWVFCPADAGDCTSCSTACPCHFILTCVQVDTNYPRKTGHARY